MKKKNKTFKQHMSKNKEEMKSPTPEAQEAKNAEVESSDENVKEEIKAEEKEETSLEEKVEKLQEQLDKEKKEYLFLMAEFDNFRKRSLKEKAEIIKNGAENAMRDILPILDDFDRALQAMETADDAQALKEGVDLIHNKFTKYLDKNGVKEMDTAGKDFDTNYHEAVTTFPTYDESMKGKIIDTVQKGYTINDKVLRHAKVVVGQ